MLLFYHLMEGWDVFVLKIKNRQKMSKNSLLIMLLSKWKHLDKIIRDLNFVREIKTIKNVHL